MQVQAVKKAAPHAMHANIVFVVVFMAYIIPHFPIPAYRLSISVMSSNGDAAPIQD
jgi:hypothetical protein